MKGPGRRLSIGTTLARHRLLLAFVILGLGMEAPLLLAADASQISKVLERLPVQTAAEKDEIGKELVKLGDSGIRKLCEMLKGDEPGDAKVRYALHGLAHYVARPGAETERKMYAGVLAQVLQADIPVATKRFLIRQVRVAGKAESVAVLKELLTVEELCEPATQTLVAIATEDTAAALRDALLKVDGKQRVTIICGVGRLRDRKCAPLLFKEAGSTDSAIRQAAVYAMANIGEPSASEALLKATRVEEASERMHAKHCSLLFAQRLVEGGHRREAKRICRNLLEQGDTGAPSIECAAFFQLWGLLGKEEALEEVVKATGSQSAAVRGAALRVAARMPGNEVTQRLAAALGKVSADHRVSLLEVLRQRRDAAALPAALDALKDREKAVRAAAIAAVGALGKKDVAPALMEFLSKGDRDESHAAQNALKSMGDEEVTEIVVAALPGAPPNARAALLSVLGARDARAHLNVILAAAEDKDEGVRLTALRILGSSADRKVLPAVVDLLVKAQSKEGQTAVGKALFDMCRRVPSKFMKETAELLIRTYEAASIPVRCELLKALKCTAPGYPGALDRVRAALKDENSEVQDAAVRTLADWPDLRPMDELLEIARNTRNMTRYVIALRGYLRMVGLSRPSKKGESDKRVEFYKSAMAAARRAEEKKQVLGAVSGMTHPEALKMAVGCLDDAALRLEASAAAIRIGSSIWKHHKAEVLAAMEEVLEVAKDERLLKQAAELARKVLRDSKK